MEQIEKDFSSLLKRETSSHKRILSSIDTIISKLRSSIPSIENENTSIEERSTDNINSFLTNQLINIKDDHKIVHASINKLTKSIDTIKKPDLENLSLPIFRNSKYLLLFFGE